MMAAYYHGGFGAHIMDIIARGFIYRTISVATRGIDLVPMLLLTVAVIAVFYFIFRRTP